jgi:hypothetical protein
LGIGDGARKPQIEAATEPAATPARPAKKAGKAKPARAAKKVKTAASVKKGAR